MPAGDFDVSHGAGSFWFRNAVPAVRQGFIPDSMSTDLHTGNFTVLSMTNVMSKFLAMGVPLQDIVRRSTVNPAQEIHRPELGTLSVGKEADIAVLELLNGSFGYIDCGLARMDAKVKLVARMTVRADGLSTIPQVSAWSSGRRHVRGISIRLNWAVLRQHGRMIFPGEEAAEDSGNGSFEFWVFHEAL